MLPTYVPADIRRNDPILAEFLNGILAACRSNRVSVSPPLLCSTDTSGTTINLGRLREASQPEQDYPSFYVYQTGDDTVKVTGGNMVYLGCDHVTWVPDSGNISVSDGDYVWIERSGGFSWGFDSGATYPPDKLNYGLAQITMVDGVITDINYQNGWAGGDIVVPESFAVDLTNDAGEAGGAGVLCSFTYSCATKGGITLAELAGSTPKISMARVVAINPTTAATEGTARFDNTGALYLWDCDEVQTVEYQTSKHIDCTTGEVSDGGLATGGDPYTPAP